MFIDLEGRGLKIHIRVENILLVRLSVSDYMCVTISILYDSLSALMISAFKFCLTYTHLYNLLHIHTHLYKHDCNQ